MMGSRLPAPIFAMLSRINIVLIEPSHPGNIGAAARVMKNMGLGHLRLVNPKQFPSEAAYTLAGRASDILDHAKIYESFEAAVGDCQCVIGTSARDRRLDWPMLEPASAAQTVLTQHQTAQVAFVFGRERIGLLNSELQQCQYHLQIPTSPAYPSLNLASAVQIVSYELFKHAQQQDTVTSPAEPELHASAEALEGFYQHLQKVLVAVDFMSIEKPGQLMPRMRRLFNKAQLNPQELSMLRGVLTAVQKKQD